MNFVPYSTSQEAWTNHFVLDKANKEKDGLYIIKKNYKTGAGPLQIVSPTEEVVKRAKAIIKRKSPTKVKASIKRRKTTTKTANKKTSKKKPLKKVHKKPRKK